MPPAAEQYEYFLKLHPKEAAAWNNLAVCYRGLSQWEKSVAASERAIQEDPRLSGAYENLADVYLRSTTTAAPRRLSSVSCPSCRRPPRPARTMTWPACVLCRVNMIWP